MSEPLSTNPTDQVNGLFWWGLRPFGKFMVPVYGQAPGTIVVVHLGGFDWCRAHLATPARRPEWAQVTRFEPGTGLKVALANAFRTVPKEYKSAAFFMVSPEDYREFTSMLRAREVGVLLSCGPELPDPGVGS